VDWADGYTLEPVSRIPTVDGKGTTDRILTSRAKELGLIPRVTGIIHDMLGDSYSLRQYFQRTAILAAEKTGREDGDADDDYVDRVLGYASQHAKQARNRGRQIHTDVHEFLTNGTIRPDPVSSMACKEISELLDFTMAEGISSEQRLGSMQAGYCGQPDLYVEKLHAQCLERFTGELWLDGYVRVIFDLKTTDLSTHKKSYREWLYQFGGYAELVPVDDPVQARQWGVYPLVYVQWLLDPWTGRSKFIPYTDADRWREAFKCLYRAWVLQSGFDKPVALRPVREIEEPEYDGNFY